MPAWMLHFICGVYGDGPWIEHPFSLGEGAGEC
jgi:hypothetical protein